MIPIDEIRHLEIRALAEEAERFLLSHHWCNEITSGSLAWAAAGVLGVFQFTIEPARPDIDDTLWVIVGDLPPAYLVLDNAPSWKEALEGYAEEMQRWVDAVRGGRRLDGIIPVNVTPIREHADMLDQRLQFIREKLIRGEYSDVESDH